VAARRFCAAARLQTVCEIVDFPEPAMPFIQKIGGKRASEVEAQVSMTERSLSLLPLAQVGASFREMCVYCAASARGSLSSLAKGQEGSEEILAT
jgi:hypothetical protein